MDNTFINKDVYLGENVDLTYPRDDDLVTLVKEKGTGCHIFKRDLSRVYQQIYVDPYDIHLVGFIWENFIF